MREWVKDGEIHVFFLILLVTLKIYKFKFIYKMLEYYVYFVFSDIYVTIYYYSN